MILEITTGLLLIASLFIHLKKQLTLAEDCRTCALILTTQSISPSVHSLLSDQSKSSRVKVRAIQNAICQGRKVRQVQDTQHFYSTYVCLVAFAEKLYYTSQSYLVYWFSNFTPFTTPVRSPPPRTEDGRGW